MPRKNLVNAVDVELATDVNSTTTSLSTVGTDGLPFAPFYIVVDPFDDVNREYMECTLRNDDFAILTVTRNLAGSVGGVGHPHLAGATVRVAIMAQHIEDLWDAVEATPDLDGTYLRLDAANGPAVRHDVAVGEELAFRISDPNGYIEAVDLLPASSTANGFQIVADIALDRWNGFPVQNIFYAAGTGSFQNMILSSSNNLTINFRDIIGTSFQFNMVNYPQIPGGERHTIKCWAADPSSILDIVGVSSQLYPTTFTDPLIELDNGPPRLFSVNTGDSTLGLLISVTLYDENGEGVNPPIVQMIASESGLPIGPVADGTTFVSGGKTWTVIGPGVSIEAIGTPITSPVATLSDLDPLEARIAALEAPA